MRVSKSTEDQSKCTTETIEWLHQVWSLNEQGQSVQPDPFYERNEKLTPEVIDDVISKIEGIFIFELERYPAYHNNAQGISAGEKLAVPGFDKYPREQKLAIVQGIDKIFIRYRLES